MQLIVPIEKKRKRRAVCHFRNIFCDCLQQYHYDDAENLHLTASTMATHTHK